MVLASRAAGFVRATMNLSGAAGMSGATGSVIGEMIETRWHGPILLAEVGRMITNL